MAEPTHGEILRELGSLSQEVKHLTESVADLKADMVAIKKDVNDWRATKEGFGIVRWGIVTFIAIMGAIGVLFKTVAGGQG